MHSVVDFFRSDARFDHQSCDIQDFSCQLHHWENNKNNETLRFTALKMKYEENHSSTTVPVSSYLAHHPHAFDVVAREDLNLRRPLQELLRL